MSESKHTPWFTGGKLPKRAGVYRIRWRVVFMFGSGELVYGWAYWSRRLGWRQGDCATAKEAFRRKHYPHHALANNPEFRPEWRGLTRPAT